MTPTQRRIEKAAELRDTLKAEGRHFDAQVVADLIGSARASSQLNGRLHTALTAALSPKNTESEHD